MIRVIYLDVKSLIPQIVMIEDKLKEYQNLVGGYIEYVSPAWYLQEWCPKSKLNDYEIIVNDSGLVDNLELNIALNPKAIYDKDYDYAGILTGNIVVTALETYKNKEHHIDIKNEDILDIMSTLKRCILINKYRQKP